MDPQALGDCYPKSIEFARDAPTLMRAGRLPEGEIMIVHGWLTPLNGPSAGKEIKHSWVEIGEEVFEVSNNNAIRSTKAAFYATFSAKLRKRYSLAEANLLATETGHAGPWDDSGS